MAIFQFDSSPESVGDNQNRAIDRGIKLPKKKRIPSNKNIISYFLVTKLLGVSRARFPIMQGILPSINQDLSPTTSKPITILVGENQPIEPDGSIDLISAIDLLNDPRYSVYNGNTNKRSSLAPIGDKNTIPIATGYSPSKTSTEMQKISGVQTEGKFSITNIGSSLINSLADGHIDADYNTKILAEFRARQEANNKLGSSTGGILTSFGGSTIKMHNFVNVDPYTGKRFGNPDKTDYNLSFNGYKDLTGLSIGTGFLWDLTIDNYGDDGGTFAPPVPSIINKSYLGSLGNFVPATEYSYNRYSTKTEQFNLFSDSSFDFITGIKRDNTLEVTLMEDQNLTWFRYFNSYMNNIIDSKTRSVAPLKQACLKVSIMSFNVAKKIFFLHRLYVVPTDYNYLIEGTESPDTKELRVVFSVVGDDEPLFL